MHQRFIYSPSTLITIGQPCSIFHTGNEVRLEKCNFLNAGHTLIHPFQAIAMALNSAQEPVEKGGLIGIDTGKMIKKTPVLFKYQPGLKGN